MKGLVIAADQSGSGKTTITLGLINALINRGYRVQGYKVGPDYVDTKFHSYISGQDSRNLDIYLMGEDGVKSSISRGYGDISVVEGVMGFYDGIGLGTKGSTYHISNLLDLPVVLVLSPKAQMATLFAQINGLLEYRENNIAGIILNNISKSYYEKLKYGIEKNCNIKVFGYLPKDEKVFIKSRKTGLVQVDEIQNFKDKIEYISSLMEQSIDIDGLINSMNVVKKYKDSFRVSKRDIKVAIAKDKVFDFYYKENLELLEEAADVEYFSVLEDEKLPENTDLLYISGGYTHIYLDELSKNKSMLNSIYNALENGLRCYAESGGLLYLTKGDKDKKLVGFLDGYYKETNLLTNFGYSKIEVDRNNPIFPVYTSANAHEFHKSLVNLENESIYLRSKENYDGLIKTWRCGYIKNETIGTYGHVHFFGNMEMFNNLLDIRR